MGSGAAGNETGVQRKSPTWSAAHPAKARAGRPVIFSTMTDVWAGLPDFPADGVADVRNLLAQGQ
jgi:hypothetical protein